MGFEHPERLLWALLALPLAAILFWPMMRRRRPTATLPLWREAVARRTAWERYQRLVLGGLLATILLLLALAAAEPYYLARAAGGRHWALIVDNSASMNVRDGEIRRGDAAIAAARDSVARMGADDAALVIASAHTAVTQCGQVSDSPALHAALLQIPPTDQPGDLPAAVRAAQAALRGAANPQIQVFTDPQGAAQLQQAADLDRTQLIVHATGDRQDNVAITRLACRSLPAHPELLEVLVEMTSFCDKLQQAKLQVRLDEWEIDRAEFTLPPGGSAVRKIQVGGGASPGLVLAELETRDALAADNHAGVLVTVAPRRRLAIANDAPDFVQRAVAALPGVEILPLGEAGKEGDADEQAGMRLYVGVVPEVFPPGPAIVIAPRADCDLWKVQEAARGTFAARWNPAAGGWSRGVKLQDWVMEEIVRLEFAGEKAAPITLGSAGDLPLLTLLPRPSGEVLVLHVDPENSDLELQPGFPLLLAHAVDQLLPAAANDFRALTTTDVLLLPAGAGREWISPAGVAQSLPATTTGAAVPRCGTWRLTGPAGERVVYANLLAPAESDLRAAALPAAPAVSDRSEQRPLWLGLAAAALLLAGVEWVLFQRGSL
ncbi:VWA domain-containing protein [Lignipirellula cremea]|uniref:VWFA domain-containing protein n=1 Tax=Lignipirellula cremea TaxID=2528010 RepID=A0A518E2R6_9BACT|nr:VWA domain-containing protein [Lignipirellula cremea]QDU98386.1 hypothetical protein Pla8534_62540 [Lignipirellula cremea]